VGCQPPFGRRASGPMRIMATSLKASAARAPPQNVPTFVPSARSLCVVSVVWGLRIRELAGLRRSRVDVLNGTVDIAEIADETGERLTPPSPGLLREESCRSLEDLDLGRLDPGAHVRLGQIEVFGSLDSGVNDRRARGGCPSKRRKPSGPYELLDGRLVRRHRKRAKAVFELDLTVGLARIELATSALSGRSG
jgi:hypothetical protein